MLAMFGVGGVGLLLLVLLLVPVVLVIKAFWVWMLVSAIQNKGLTDGERTGWVLAIVFLHVIGALIYLCIGHPKRNVPRPATA